MIPLFFNSGPPTRIAICLFVHPVLLEAGEAVGRGTKGDATALALRTGKIKTFEEAADQIVGPVADVAPIRPVEAAVHPLASARTTRQRPEPTQVPSAAETPMLARAFFGVDRHPAVPSDESDPAVDPFGDQSWDQRDQREVLDEQDDDGQFIFGGEPGA